MRHEQEESSQGYPSMETREKCVGNIQIDRYRRVASVDFSQNSVTTNAAQAATRQEQPMATPKKKHLIELMIEAGVKWPDGAEYAAQDKFNLCVNFFGSEGAPVYHRGHDSWSDDEEGWLGIGCGVYLPSLCRNWHQTIVTLEQYAEALAANVGEPAGMSSKSNHGRESEDIQAVDAVEWHNSPSIEQLTANYHAKASEADRLQAVADDALNAADDALLELEKAGELLGLVISVDTKPKQVEQPAQPEITDWRDLRVGDVIIIDYVDVEPVRKNALEGVESVIVSDGDEYPVCATNENYPNGESFNMGGMREKRWRFIRRP